jgi:uncharacterized protein (DUF2062 family)
LGWQRAGHGRKVSIAAPAVKPAVFMDSPASSASTPPARKFWRRWFVDPLLQQLKQGVSPEKIALTLAVGSAVALFPILGTTTLLCLAAGIVLRLNQPIIQGINFLCAAIWIPLFIAFVRLGDRMTRTASASLNVPAMASLLAHHPREFLHQFGVTAWHGIFGWAVAMVVWTPSAYLLSRPVLRAAARRIGRRRQAA